MKLIDQLWHECKNMLTIDELDRLCTYGFAEKGEVEALIFQKLESAELSDKDLLARLESLQMLQNRPDLLESFVARSNNPLFTEYYKNVSFSELFQRLEQSPLPKLWGILIRKKFHFSQLDEATDSELYKLYESDLLDWRDRWRILEIIRSRIPKLNSEELSAEELMQKLLEVYQTFPFVGGIFLKDMEKLQYIESHLLEMFQKNTISPGTFLLLLFKNSNVTLPVLRGDLMLREEKNPFAPFYPHPGYWEMDEELDLEDPRSGQTDGSPYSYDEMDNSEIRKEFLNGNMQLVVPFFSIQQNYSRNTIWHWYSRLKDESFYLDLQRDQINGLNSGMIPPERFSFGLIEDDYTLRRLAEAGRFDSLPWTWSFFYSRGWDNRGECNPFISPMERERLSKEWYWLEMCILLRPEMQDKNIQSVGQMEEICRKCPFRDACHENEKVRFPFNLNFLYKLPDDLNSDYNQSFLDLDYSENDEVLRSEDDELGLYEELYRPARRSGGRHKKDDEDDNGRFYFWFGGYGDLEERVRAEFKKWDKELEPLVQTVAFLMHHVIPTPGRNGGTWQAAANWLFEVNEKRLTDAVANLDSTKMLKLAQLCSRLPWPKMKKLLSAPVDELFNNSPWGSYYSYYWVAYKELFQGTDEPLSEYAEEMLQKEVFAQVYRLARGWAKIC